MKTIKLPCFGIVVNIDYAKGTGATISSDLHDERYVCPYCGKALCNFDCYGSQSGQGNEIENDDEVKGRLQFHGSMDAIESIVLAHACAGVDIETPAYLKGIETAVQACGENL